MLRKMFSYGGPLLLAGVALFAAPSAGQAQRHGGGHIGGAHVRGAHFGGGHFGGAHVGGTHFGGAHVGGYHGGFSHYGYHPNNWHYGYRPYYRHYGYYGYYPYSYGYNPTYDTYPYVGSGLTYDSGPYGLSGDEPLSYSNDSPFVTVPAAGSQADSPPATATNQPDRIVHITVQVPAGAQVWFDDTATTSTGSTRQFTSPPLTPGQRYSYEVRARWNENGKEVTQIQKVEVTAGAHVQITFPVSPKTAG
jgi:uncharacterized protein (TIGR03000 family)